MTDGECQHSACTDPELVADELKDYLKPIECSEDDLVQQELVGRLELKSQTVDVVS